MSQPPLPVVFARHHALEAGYSRGQVARRLGSGAWRALRRGTYCRSSSWDDATPQQQHRLLTLAALVALDDATAPGTATSPTSGTAPQRRPLMAVSHVSAACLFGWPQPLEGWGRPHLTTPRPGGRGRQRSDVWVHTAALTPDDVVVRSGVAITSPARTVTDVLRLLPPAEAVAMADHAVRSGHARHDAVVATMGRQTGWPHVDRARQALMLVDPRRESWLESWSLVVLHEHGVPQPVPQARVLDESSRFVARVDAYWPQYATVGEADGAVKYQVRGPYIMAGDTTAEVAIARAQQRLDEQRRRHERLLELGLRVVRWCARDVIDDPDAVARRVVDSLERGDPARVRGQILLPEPLPWAGSGATPAWLRGDLHSHRPIHPR